MSDTENLNEAADSGLIQSPLVRHCCYECGKGRGISYTAKPWSGPCYISRS